MWTFPGNPMPAPGLYPGMADAEYFAIGALSNSAMGHFVKSPAHFKYYLEAGTVETPAMLFGRLYHCAVLTPSEVEGRYMVADETRQSTKIGKANAEEAKAHGLELISTDTMAEVEMMRDGVLRNAGAKMLLDHPGTQTEVSCFWHEEVDGVQLPCKCKLDILNRSILNGMAADLKSTGDASPQSFPKSIANFGYHRQAAWYSRGPKRAAGIDINAFAFICQEKEPPYLTGLYTIAGGAQHQALMQIKDILKSLVWCMKSDSWGGYPEEFIELDLPKWAQGA